MAKMTTSNEKLKDTVKARYVPAGTLVRYTGGRCVYMVLEWSAGQDEVKFISLESGREYRVNRDKIIRPLQKTESVTLVNTDYNLGEGIKI